MRVLQVKDLTAKHLTPNCVIQVENKIFYDGQLFIKFIYQTRVHAPSQRIFLLGWIFFFFYESCQIFVKH